MPSLSNLLKTPSVPWQLSLLFVEGRLADPRGCVLQN